MNKVTIVPSDDLMKELRRERENRKIDNIPNTIVAVLRDYFKMQKPDIPIGWQGKKDLFHRARALSNEH